MLFILKPRTDWGAASSLHRLAANPTTAQSVRPRIQLRISISLGRFAKHRFRDADDVLRGEAEVLRQVFERGRGAETGDPEDAAILADEMLPAKGARGLDGQPAFDGPRQ